MPARISPEHDALTRLKIKTSQLVNRLQDFALSSGEISMADGQIRAALGLLKKTLPDLSAAEITSLRERSVKDLSLDELRAIVASRIERARAGADPAANGATEPGSVH